MENNEQNAEENNVVENIEENNVVAIKPERVITLEIIQRANIINGMDAETVAARINAVFDKLEAEQA